MANQLICVLASCPIHALQVPAGAAAADAADDEIVERVSAGDFCLASLVLNYPASAVVKLHRRDAFQFELALDAPSALCNRRLMVISYGTPAASGR